MLIDVCGTLLFSQILFELVSAYGNVGLSLGSIKYPDSPCSFSLDLTHGARFVVMAVMLLGRTRDLPMRIDSALTISFSDENDILAGTAEMDRQSVSDDFVSSRNPLSSGSNQATRHRGASRRGGTAKEHRRSQSK